MDHSDNISVEDLDHARELLNSAKTKTKILPNLNKNGQKLNHRHDTPEEVNCLENFYENFHKHNTHLKVTKLCAIGVAEWLPGLKVAKLIKDRKFAHYMGRQHVEKFPFLFAEEALYLLDAGDIELRLNQLPLSLQDAFSLLTCAEKENDNMLCTLDEFYVFSWFMKAGYTLQRYPIPSIVKKRIPNIVAKEKTLVDSLQSCSTSQMDFSTELKENGSNSNGCSSQTSEENDTPLWGTFDDIMALLKSKELELDAKIKAEEDLIGPKLPSFRDLVPEDVPDTINFTCEPTITREVRRHIDKNREIVKIAQSSPDWKTYKAKLHALKTGRRGRGSENSHIFTKGRTKPLIGSWEESLHYSGEVLSKLKIFNQTSEVIPPCDDNLRVTFSVYKREEKFSKNNPGKPFCQLVIVKPDSPMLSFEQVSHLQKDDSVPIKIAIVSNGSINFVDVNCVKIPDSIFLG